MSCLTSTDEIIMNVGESMRVSMDFTDLINNIDSSLTITNATPTCSSSDITINSASIVGKIVYFFITSSVVGNYTIEVEITLSDTEVFIGEGGLKVRDR